MCSTCKGGPKRRALTVTTAPPLTYINRVSRFIVHHTEPVGLGTSHAGQVSERIRILFSFGRMTYDEEYHGNWCRSTSLRTGRDGKGAVNWGLIKAKCAEVKPGGGRIKDCVKTHAAEFSDP